jgi:hypothetical protein
MSEQEQVVDAETSEAEEAKPPISAVVRDYLAERWRIFVREVVGDRARVGPLFFESNGAHDINCEAFGPRQQHRGGANEIEMEQGRWRLHGRA